MTHTHLVTNITPEDTKPQSIYFASGSDVLGVGESRVADGGGVTGRRRRRRRRSADLGGVSTRLITAAGEEALNNTPCLGSHVLIK